MVEITSYELSCQPRDAGFPQPDIAKGQLWYTKNGAEIRVHAVNTLRHFGTQVVYILMGHIDSCPIEDSSTLFAVYAPSVLDILKELPNGTTLKQDVVGSVKVWVVETSHFGDVRGRIFRAMSESNALSAAYLYKEETDEDEKQMNRLGYPSERQSLARLVNEINDNHNKKS